MPDNILHIGVRLVIARTHTIFTSKNINRGGKSARELKARNCCFQYSERQKAPNESQDAKLTSCLSTHNSISASLSSSSSRKKGCCPRHDGVRQVHQNNGQGLGYTARGRDRWGQRVVLVLLLLSSCTLGVIRFTFTVSRHTADNYLHQQTSAIQPFGEPYRPYSPSTGDKGTSPSYLTYLTRVSTDMWKLHAAQPNTMWKPRDAKWTPHEEETRSVRRKAQNARSIKHDALYVPSGCPGPR